jgi:ESCRT-II complex subunit VPS36
MILLTDVYCLVNRARGTQLISPLDCLTACRQFATLPTALRLKEFQTGVKAIVADAHTEESIAKRIQLLLQGEEQLLHSPSYASISPLRLSSLWHISILLAKQYLCVAEQFSVLCRDEAVQGLNFYLNHFNQWT